MKEMWSTLIGDKSRAPRRLCCDSVSASARRTQAREVTYIPGYDDAQPLLSMSDGEGSRGVMSEVLKVHPAFSVSAASRGTE
jgi:hypothetical protein